MSESDVFERILASLHEVAFDPARWSSVSALMDEALRVHGSSMAVADGDSEENVRVHASWIFFRGEPRRELEREYFRVYYPVDERVPRLRHLPDGELFHATDLLTAEELKTSATYNEMLARGHCRDAIHMRMDGHDSTRIVWVVHDPVDGDGWSSAQLDSIRRLVPHVRQCVRVQQVLAGANALGVTQSELLDATGAGIIQFDARGRIVAANDRARDLLRAGGALFDEGGFLYARERQDNADLQGLLCRALPTWGGRSAGGSVLLRRSADRPPLLLHVNPVARRETDFGVWPVAALVLIVDPAHGTRVDPGVVASALGLTEMESRVAVLLAEGKNVREIAALTRRKESTIRTHVKSVYAKHGLSRQTELVRMTLSLAGKPGARR